MSPGGAKPQTAPCGLTTSSVATSRAAGPSRDQAVAAFVLLALVDAGDAPGHMVVDGGALAGQPHQGHDGEAAVLLGVQDVLPVALAGRPRAARR